TYVCAPKFEPATVATYVDPTIVVDVDSVRSVATRGAVWAIFPCYKIFPLLARSTRPPTTGLPMMFPQQVAFPAASLQGPVSLPTVVVTIRRVAASVKPVRLANAFILRPSCANVAVPFDPNAAWLAARTG